LLPTCCPLAGRSVAVSSARRIASDAAAPGPALSLFGSGEGRHVTAEELHVEARAAGHRVSLATIYNTLHSFASVGLVREIAFGGAKRYFDTNTSNHNHFHITRDGMLMDIDAAAVRVDGLPTPPPGMRIAHIDVVVHLEPAE